ncbi:DUF4339 domain-containing protein [Enterobacter sp. BRE11]|nr:DUF4339 domain-containing protein [Enterobacter sp. BRE11]
MANWWYLDGNDKQGPYDERAFAEIVKNKPLNANTQIWTSGFDRWLQLSDVPHFLGVTSQYETPPPAPVVTNKPTAKNTKNAQKIQLGAIALLAATALSLALYIYIKPSTPDFASQAFNASFGKPLAWINLDTLKSVGVTSSYRIEGSLQDGQRITAFTDAFTNAEMGVSSEKTPDDLDKYVDDLRKSYAKRGRSVTNAQFIQLHGEKAWEASGFIDPEEQQAFKITVHKNNGLIWITLANYPGWLGLKGERADFYNQLLNTTFM